MRGTTLPTLPVASVMLFSALGSNHVPVLHEGEVDNGRDDNENQLDDEPGLVFAVPQQELGHEREVFIHLTVERTDPQGKAFPLRREINVTCRN